MKLFWHKTNDLGIIPSKRPEDAGFDIYSCVDSYLLMPGEKHLFPTGVAAAAEPGWWLLAFDRGSTGSRAFILIAALLIMATEARYLFAFAMITAIP